MKEQKKASTKKSTKKAIRKKITKAKKSQRDFSLHARAKAKDENPGKSVLRYSIITGALIVCSALTAFAIYVATKPQQVKDIILPSGVSEVSREMPMGIPALEQSVRDQVSPEAQRITETAETMETVGARETTGDSTVTTQGSNADVGAGLSLGDDSASAGQGDQVETQGLELGAEEDAEPKRILY